MKIETTRPKRYKNYFTVGVAIEAPRLKAWKFKGMIYTNLGKELKHLESRQATCWDKKSAQYYGLQMCRYWIDNYPAKLERLLKAPPNTRNNPQTAIPVRFLVACREGHLSDFPWIDYIHHGAKPCVWISLGFGA